MIARYRTVAIVDEVEEAVDRQDGEEEEEEEEEEDGADDTDSPVGRSSATDMPPTSQASAGTGSETGKKPGGSETGKKLGGSQTGKKAESCAFFELC